MRIAVLISGTGTILKAMIDAGLPIGLVVADRKCIGLMHAEKARIPHMIIGRAFGADFDRGRYTRTLIAVLREYEVGMVVMTGFMTVLTAEMFAQDAYDGKVFNTHPSLLPSFPGAHAVRDALAHGVKVTGCTVHLATTELDAGPIIAQEAVYVLPGDTKESLLARIKQAERDLCVSVVRGLAGVSPAPDHVWV